jgi:hypothetical protein
MPTVVAEIPRGNAYAGLWLSSAITALTETRVWHHGYLIKQGSSTGPWLEDTMSPTIAECLENTRQCEWYAARTNNEADQKFLLRKAHDWTKLAKEKELEIRASARAAA